MNLLHAPHSGTTPVPVQVLAGPAQPRLSRGAAVVIAFLAATVIGLGAGVLWRLLGADMRDAVETGAGAFAVSLGLGLGLAAYFLPAPPPPAPYSPPPTPGHHHP
ncbi:hypothetical protein ACIGHB_29955 [Streptomyces sp. NPDC085460]|uniref:hypothetical protein n=1 Tax=Streptomyces sp. NPDC085460 TaxID=3365723 RepID=UPI0037D0319E